jgi:5-methyltetrahydrofolate--homocysteine methyltransferase
MFSFRGNDTVRSDALGFLVSFQNGMTMGIVNPEMLSIYEIPERLEHVKM